LHSFLVFQAVAVNKLDLYVNSACYCFCFVFFFIVIVIVSLTLQTVHGSTTLCVTFESIIYLNRASWPIPSYR